MNFSAETKEQILVALANAQALEDARETLKQAEINFRTSSHIITVITGYELWHTETGGGKYFWKHDREESALFPGPADAIRAFLDGKIVWKRRAIP